MRIDAKAAVIREGRQVEALKHPMQQERLRALRSYDILDTARESDFDDIATLASQICGTPISVVNLIDADRQWFKAETGLGVRETPLDTSICSHVILEDAFVEIPDTLADPRMVDNPLCTGEPGLRFYAGAQLISEDGLPLGTLCVLDYQPRSLTPLQRETLRVLARQVVAQLEMRKALKANTLLRQEVDHRVTNSLQSLGSLVGIQKRRAKSEETQSALASVASRIEAVAQLHALLYRTDSGPVINVRQYVPALTDHLSAVAPQNVTVSADVGDFSVLSTEAVALGTLINEFVSNAFKHAFPDDRPGEVNIRIVAGSAPNSLRVTCSDNGVGLPEQAEPDTGGLGLLIAQVLSAELDTTLEVDSTDDGLSLSIEFVTDHPQSRA
ncbi:GAF domain-containing protein [Roseovarius spongiae]|uniref:GAF domain-containing protein n=1 Tax=Roseovarius spongiae TaxID=2320272 RepID=A0A3A8B2Q9_9RHOB|nr:histidine kinase dimerization/phosphoacceptor domain -containing protein [Roseovarius spongiae]RKF14075.1 GAF domain-containing protein [Roseovarius spongiae]